MLYDVLFFLLYFRVSDIYFSNQFTFRSFHCSSLALLSLKNTIHYREYILDPNHSLQTLYLHSNQSNTITIYNNYDEQFFLKIIPFYFMMYIIYDLKHCFKRIDLFIHHIICLIWSYNSIHCLLGFISFCIIAEGVTFAYSINGLKNQLIYRLIFTLFIRFPVWIILSVYVYPSKISYFIYVFNYTVVSIMILLDCIWFIQNTRKLKKIYADANSNTMI